MRGAGRMVVADEVVDGEEVEAEVRMAVGLR